MIKALFITHDVSVYGASRSLQALLSNYQNHGVQIDLAINKKFFGKNDHVKVSSLFKVDADAIYEFYLPFSFCWVGKSKMPIPVVLKNKLSVLARSQMRRFIDEKKYDVIYLNSLVLHSLITTNVNCIIHVREIFDNSDETVIQNLKRARGLIFIDQSTRDAFKDVPFRNAIILNNPFDMNKVEGVSVTSLPLSTEKRTVISMIGQIHEGKGTLFIIKAFIRTPNNANAILLIVGGGDENYMLACKKAAKGKGNIIFLGEQSEIEKVYRISDYIIRGESMPCIGRTIYEGLYSGCHVIIPGTSNDNSLGIENEYQNFVHFYEPRNDNALGNVFSKCIGNKITNRKYNSNVKEYVEKFHSFLIDSITSK
jgi:glycosyltransferase involved in cell wall biosynthesis